MVNTLPELLSPAGNVERFYAALRYGADAVYIGASNMSLRNFADNFSDEEIHTCCAYAHAHNKKVYLTCNAFARDTDMPMVESIAATAVSACIDALIVNDPGVIRLLRRVAPNMPLHLSTQANTLNAEACAFWFEQGISRIVLARELTLDNIRAIRANTPPELEFEVFVHGAMCVSYSGRCLLSNYMSGRDSNRGECAQPCRWRYELREKGKDGLYFPIVENEAGTFILNSRDMNLCRYIPELIDAGVCSLKIEGRMKSVLYVATVTNAYRTALDLYAKSKDCGIPYELPEYLLTELEHISHRPYTTGFMFDEAKQDGQEHSSSGYVSDSEIVAVVLSYDAENKRALIRQRNRFFVGDTLSILAPNDVLRSFKVELMKDTEGVVRDSAPHPNERLYIYNVPSVSEGDILRKNDI